MKTKTLLLCAILLAFTSCETKNEVSQTSLGNKSIIEGSTWKGTSSFQMVSFDKDGSMYISFDSSYTKYNWSARNGRYTTYVENGKQKIDYTFEASFYAYGATTPTWVTFHGNSVVFQDSTREYYMLMIAEGQLPSPYGTKQFIGEVYLVK